MYKFLMLFCFSVASSVAYGQTDPLSKEDMRILDSMFNNDEFIKLIMGKDKSYFDVNLGIGNGVFSLKNNALNAKQAQTTKMYYKPAAGYNHKSGLGIAVNGFLAADSGSLKMVQYAISPAYTFSNKKFAAGISYTRYIKGSSASFDISPVTNDFYASALYKKTWIQPGLAVGYSLGKQVEYFDTTFWLQNRVVHIRDTITSTLSSLFITLSATHTWDFNKLFDRHDALELQPTLLLNAGSQRWNTSHSNSINSRLPLVQKYLKRRYGDGTATEKFNLQSLAFLAGVTYYYGKFYLQPQLYLDYYLPTTTEKRLTSLVSVTAGFWFY